MRWSECERSVKWPHLGRRLFCAVLVVVSIRAGRGGDVLILELREETVQGSGNLRRNQTKDGPSRVKLQEIKKRSGYETA